MNKSINKKRNSQSVIIKKLEENIELLKGYDLDPSDPKILDKVVSHYKDIVGEENNIKIIFLAAISRKLPKSIRIHIANHSSSGSGKSWLAKSVLKPFWNDVEQISRFTDAWFNRAIDDFDGRIILWQEVNKMDSQGKGTTGQMKLLLSENKISYKVMEQTSEGWTPREYSSDAVPVIITTTTHTINDEDGRRFFILGNDESEEQTSKIIEHNLKNVSSPKFVEEIEKSYQQLILLTEFYTKMAEEITEIMVPFAPKLTKLVPKYLQMRTNITRLIQLTKLVAFANLMNRNWIVGKDENNSIKKSLIADIQDFNEAIKISEKFLTGSKYGLSQGSLKLMHTIQKLIQEKGKKLDYEDISFEEIWPTITECKIAMGNIPRGTFYSYLNPLKENGYVQDQQIQHSKEKCLRLTELSIDDFSIDNFEFSEEELHKWIEKEFDGNVKVIKPTIENLYNDS